MNVLISQRHAINNHGQWCDSLENEYVYCFAAFGITLFPVPNDSGCLNTMIRTVCPSGIILSGGGDVSPAFSGGELLDNAQVSVVRDQIEATLLDHSLRNRIPVLGICRGLQFINAYFKGTLITDLNLLVPGEDHPCPGKHPISILHKDLVTLLGGNDSVDVNSYHHQGIAQKGLAQELRSFAVAVDLGIIEGLYHPEHPLAAVQWHPERAAETAPLDRVLIEAFRDGTLFWR
jgi:gamma-glutamyl-gamma-aminobutyrate hydrolase PuuD